ncbi:hypothetical protein [Paenibacillus oryzisoli]|uniref:Uncharacterized protein n=1 Tax=Paenibacillus oryzisoli TaxID=1850517 RepID=A0A198A7Q3_9BACL|nr:hypothetical protein [Paenibacillus oryzisoli]OAS17003.1 hypothetical protein A8708_01910 [Paenibacillus oryzisoli]
MYLLLQECSEADALFQIRKDRANKEATVVGRPMTIETNMQNGRVKLIMPLKDVILTPNEMKDLIETPHSVYEWL